MEKYKCDICRKHHPIFRSMEVPLPRLISEMEEEEREIRVKNFDGLLVVDEQMIFANGWINIEVANHEFPFFYWKTWTSISKDEFSQYFKDLKSGKVIELQGKLEEELPFYPNSKDLKSKTLLQATNENLVIEIQIEEDSQLKEDQSKPITEKRMIEIMQMLHHNPKRKSKYKAGKSFRDRLSVELINTENEYMINEKDFVININSGTVLFQIVSNRMLEANPNSKVGFGLHLSFDDSFDDSKEEIARFRSKEYSKEFNYYSLDDIPTYQIDLGANKQHLIQLVESIISEVYEDDLEMIEIDYMEL